jgi:hypothetical protein
MESTIVWYAKELVKRDGFLDGQFRPAQWELVEPALCRGKACASLAADSHLPGETFPDYVLCLVEQLKQRGVLYPVLKGTVSGHNDYVLDSFVFDSTHYVVRRSGSQVWFDRLPEELQAIFNTTWVKLKLSAGNG